MKQKISLLFANPLIYGSIFMIVGSNLVNLLGYIYHFLIGRMLSPASYSELAALYSLMGLISMIPTSLGLTIIKFVSSSKNEKETDELIYWLTSKSRLIAIFMCVLTIFATPLLMKFLNIDNTYLIWLSSISLLFSIPALFNRSILQGLIRFKESVLSVVVDTIIKVFGGVLLVYMGFSVGGALVAMVVGVGVGWFLYIYYIRDHLKIETSHDIDFSSMVKYSVPVLIQTVATTSLLSTDIVLVKHYFPAHQAGMYAAMSILSKVIFFASGPIGSVMFPLVSKQQSSGADFRQVFSYSLILTFLISVIVLMFYYFYPDLAIRMLYGSSYLEYYYLLFPFGVSITLFTLANVLMSFCLSINKTRVVYIALVAGILQVLGILYSHNTLYDVIVVSMVVNALMLTALVVYSNRIINLLRVARGKYIY
jgi:O-antigen/teichoic acid export membrane protein